MKEFEPNFNKNGKLNKNEKGDKEEEINLEKDGVHLTEEDLKFYLAYETTNIVPEGLEKELDRIRNHLLGPAGTGGCKDCKERLEELRGERS